MSIFDKHGSFWFTNDAITDEDKEKMEKDHEAYYKELMNMYQQYYGMITDTEEEFVTRGSILACTYGARYARLDCPEDYGVMKDGEDPLPICTTVDCSEYHIHGFGSCFCPEKDYQGRLPMTTAWESPGKLAEKAKYNASAHICIPLIDEEQGWLQNPEATIKVLVKINKNVYSSLLLDKAVLVCQYGGMITIEEVPDVEEKVVKQGNLLTYLSVDFVNWLIEMEAGDYQPYRDEKDSEEAQKRRNVTITPGMTFDIEKTNWDLLEKHFDWTQEQIREIIRILYEGSEEEREKVKIDFTITPEQSYNMFYELAQEYIEDVNRAITWFRNKYEFVEDYTQNELEAMFDYAYTHGLKTNSVIEDQDQIIGYYLKKDLEGARSAVKRLGTSQKKRRINEMHLFFCGGYDIYDVGTPGFNSYRTNLGFKD